MTSLEFPVDVMQLSLIKSSWHNQRDGMKMRHGRELNNRIVSDPAISGGEPCIRDTRIPVQIILSHLAAGDSVEAIIKNFPRITREDVNACLEYAAFLATEKILPA